MGADQSDWASCGLLHGVARGGAGCVDEDYLKVCAQTMLFEIEER